MDLSGTNDSAFIALHASVWSDSIAKLKLLNLPISNRDSPDLLNVSRVLELPELLTMATSEVTVLIGGSNQAEWRKLAGSAPLLSSIDWVVE